MIRGAASTARTLLGFAFGAGLCVASVQTAAQQIEINEGECAQGIRLTARGARLSEVLRRMAETLRFDLHFEAKSDPMIDIDLQRPGPELIAKLAPADSTIVTQAPDPRCPRQHRIVKVWVLPSANVGVASAAPPPQQAAPPKPVAQPQAGTAPQYDPRRVEEMARLRKEMYDTYVRLHGRPPPDHPEDPAN